MVGRQNSNWSVIGTLKRAVKKISFLLSINMSRLRIASMLRNDRRQRRTLSFNDRPGLRGIFVENDEEEEDEESDESKRVLTRAKSCCSSDEDVDKKAELFIANFRRQLLLERQISLQIRYHRGSSFDRDY